jgi:hypothetical protein
VNFGHFKSEFIMRKLFTIASLLAAFGAQAQQGPGLVISEVLPNPAGTDSPFELIELVATRTINFSTTPYTVVAANNGTATAQGWIAGGALGYAFQISSGTVNAGDVVYVGGTSMATTGTVLRAINTGTTPGDGFGSSNSSGVVGNGGTNADAIGIFNMPVASITSSTVPVDAVFYGSAIGSAIVNAGADGYQMPVNDLYAGGKLQSTAFLAPDPGSAQYITATGAFNPATGAFTTARSFVLTSTFSDNVTGITLGTVASPTLTFSGTHVFVNENATSVNVTVNVAGANNGQVVFTLGGLPYSTAGAADYTAQTVVVAAGVSGAQTVTIPISNDALQEKDEYIALAFTSLYNGSASATAVYHIYIKDEDTPVPVATNEIFLDSVSTFQNGASGSNSAEIVAHDPATQRLYIANSIAAKLDIVDFSNPATPTLLTSISMLPAYGNINSVAVRDSVVACAIENATNPQDPGKVVFFDYNGVYISEVTVGAMPDMLTFNHAGNKIVIACEGEPNNAYTNDPDGVVCVVDISGGVQNVTQANVATITFTAYNGQENALRASGIRIYGPFNQASKDFEPEYVTVSDNDQLCWVTLQENNAMAMIDLTTNSVASVVPLGYKNYMTGSNALDGSDQTTGIALMNAPVFGMYQPDAISQYTVNNQVYLLTANEGDARAWSGLNEESRLSGLTLDPLAFPYGTQMKQNTMLGRLNCTNRLGDTDNDGDFDQIYTYGARSFSIWNGTTGSQVFDSGDQLERITATHPVYAPLFNMSNGTGAGTWKNRSDDKGPEPEGSAVAQINGDHFAFLCLERTGGVMVFNVNNPLAPTYATYRNHRTPTAGPDRGAEGIIYIPDSLSPNGNDLVILANEVSSTLTILQVTTCAERAGVAVTPASYDGCTGGNITLNATAVANTGYQWYMNDAIIAGANTATYNATASGEYQVMITNSTYGCTGKSEIVPVIFHAAPAVNATAASPAICDGSSTTLNGTGAATYNWMPGSLSGTTVTVSPAASTTYTVTGTDVFGCTNTQTVAVAVNPLPNVTASSTLTTICNGSSVSLDGSGAASYSWMPGSLSGSTVSVSPTASTTYTVTGTDANGCTNTSTVAISVLARPAVTASSPVTQVCNGSSTTLNGGGAATYNWMPNNQNGASVTATITASTTFTVTGTAANGCTNTATVSITMLPTPTVTATSNTATVCSGTAVNLMATGTNAANYIWFPGMLTGQNITTVPSASTTYTVNGYAANGCTHSSTVAITVNPSPALTTGGSTSICEGSSSTLTVSGADTYAWEPGSLSGNSQTLSPATTTTYTITGTALNGCLDSVSVTLTVNANPTASLTVSTDTACNIDAVIALGGLPAGGMYYGNNVTGNTFDPATAAIGTTPISYVYVDVNGCTDTANSSITVDVCTGIENVQTGNANAYPNPFTDRLTLTSTTIIERVEVYNAAGQLLFAQQTNATMVELNMSEYESGVYFVRLTGGEASTMITAVKM